MKLALITYDREAVTEERKNSGDREVAGMYKEFTEETRPIVKCDFG